MKKGLTFDDVTLLPQYSEVESRSNIVLDMELDNNIVLDLPIISAPCHPFLHVPPP